MSLVLRTLEAFPGGRTTEEILALLDVDFDPQKRLAVIAGLDELAAQGVARRGRDGKWKVLRRSPAPTFGAVLPALDGVTSDELLAVPARFEELPSDADSQSEPERAPALEPSALLRYWRAALRADPRGAITQVDDRHGISWQLVTGAGPLVSDAGNRIRITLELDHLADEFRQALLKRQANEQSLAIGWPIAVGRKSGVPAIWPVGLLSADWTHRDGRLEITIEDGGVMTNPDWVKATARSSGWSETGLRSALAGDDGAGLAFDDFVSQLREACAGSFRGRLSGRQFASRLSQAEVGIHDILGLFLPTDTTFTAGAVRDLDSIATWATERLSRTALAPLLNLDHRSESREVTPLNVSDLNSEQYAAVRHACRAPLSVVTGPPGTGKSQTIISVVASVLASGGSVLVASKNHQALDAVEQRLTSLAPDTDFLVRTLNPSEDLNQGLADVVKHLSSTTPQHTRGYDPLLLEKLRELSVAQEQLTDLLERRSAAHCEIADLLERIDARERHVPELSLAKPGTARDDPWWRRVLAALSGVLRRFRGKTQAPGEPPAQGASLQELRARLAALRAELESTVPGDEPARLATDISDLVQRVLPPLLAKRAQLSDDERRSLADASDDLELQNRDPRDSPELARLAIRHRPLWLASVLGTPNRIPLDDDLFDLVVFDEASQCDIASALPLFARARRAMVVGDDNQLSFIPQIGIAQDRNLMQAQGLPSANMGRYAQSRRSLFDFAARIPGTPRVLLRDQYRSTEDIVEYISTQFYGGKLRTAYDPARMKAVAGAKPGISWTHVPAPVDPRSTNVNPAETSAIIEHLHTLLVRERYTGSVGVISLFRPQANAIAEAVDARLPAEARKRADLRVGTVDSFQGQERDVILFSPCVGRTSAMSAVTFLQRDWRRLNVAISRARVIAHVFGDLEFARSSAVKSLARLAAFATEPRKKTAEGVFDSEWERRVYEALCARGLQPIPQYDLAGRRLDFALFGKDGVRLDLEVDGRQWHTDSDGRRKVGDIWRDQQLRSLGWRVRRFWVDELANDLEGCLDIIERDLS